MTLSNKKPQFKITLNPLVLSGIAAFFIAVAAWALVEGSKDTTAQTSEGQVTVEGKVELTSRGDFNKNGEVDAGDTVALTFRIRNLTDTEHSFAKLVTGVDNNLFYDIWNLQGAASLSEENNTISFPNLLLPARSKQFVTVETTIKYFTEGEQHIRLVPQLLDKNGNPIGTIIPNDHADRVVKPWMGELPWWIEMPVASPFPTIEPSSTPIPTATTEPTPEITPETGPTPTPTAETSPTPLPSETVTPTP